MANQQYFNPLSAGNNGDYYAYQSRSNPIEALNGLLKTVADEPAIRHQKEEEDRKRNMELSKLYTTPVPDFAFRWQGDQQKQLDEINTLGTELMAAGYDPYKTQSALNNPAMAQKFKDFHQKSNLLSQTSQTSKYLQSTWDGLVKSVREHPDKYQDDALDRINSFYNKGLDEIMAGGQPLPDLTQLEKPYDFKNWANKTKNAIDPTQNGHIIRRMPGAIENNFLAEWTNEPKSQRYWANTFASLPEATRMRYARAALRADTKPEYLYGLEVAKETMTGFKQRPLAEWEVYGPASSRTQASTTSLNPYSAPVNPADATFIATKNGKTMGAIPGFKATPMSTTQNIDLANGYFDLGKGGAPGKPVASGSYNFKSSELISVPVDANGKPYTKEQYAALPAGAQVTNVPMMVGSVKVNGLDKQVMVPASQIPINKAGTKAMQQTLKTFDNAGGAVKPSAKKAKTVNKKTIPGF